MNLGFNAYLVAFTAAFASAALTLPLLRKWCWRTGLVDDPGQRKIHTAPVPLAGGLAILAGLLLPLLMGVGLLQLGAASGRMIVHTGPRAGPEFSGTGSLSILLLTYGLNRRVLQLSAVLLGALGMAALGLWDDRKDLRPAVKFAGQLLIAVLTAAAGVRITLFVPSVAFSVAVTVLWILTVTNAFNFMDNMNGLCTGLGAIAAWCIALNAVAQVHYLVASMAFLVCGALLGFLPYNFPRATAFLGDSGSHLIGYLLAVLTILPHFYSALNPRPWAVLSPLLILAVPLVDLAWVVWLRWRLGKPFYVGDTNHLSHQLARRGLSQTQAVLLLWLAAAVMGTASLWL
jgi:UDP-GlcNAc:undecaprenyl-phosphate/decaprenyl-phosphate GlcNAc-1-phosphate transferase